MNTDALMSRGNLLLQQDRPQQAAEQFRLALAQDPNHADAHAMLCLCMLNDKDMWPEATREAEMAVHIAPDSGLSHYAHAAILSKRNQLADALTAIGASLAIDPYNSGSYAMASSIHAQSKRWSDSLDMATRGLEVDPENGTCSYLRSLSLERLGKTQDAASEAAAAVRKNPDSAAAHAMRGWALLQSGDHQQAQDAFRESLRLDPTDDFARSGMIQALNSDRLIFRLVFRFYSAMGRLAGGMRWAVILGLFIGMRLLRMLASQYPSLQPYVLPISILYILFCLLTWIADPLFNTFLRFHPFGKYLLSGKERLASNLLAVCVSGGVIGGLIVAIQGDYPGALIVFGCMVGLSLPVSTAFRIEEGWPQTLGIVIASVLSLFCLAACGLLIAGSELWTLAFLPYALGILVFSFLGNYLVSVSVKH